MINVIDADNICKSFGKNHVLKSLSFQVPEGAIYAICGKNGIGKSVLFRILTGFILPDTGSVKIHGQQIGKDLEFPKSTGILIDRPGYMPDSSGYANLALLGQISGLADEKTIRVSLDLVGLDPDDKKPVRTYSVGMLQRLGLAQAIMEDPQLILLDEPTSGLDYESQIEMHELFLKLRDQGKTIVFTSHSPWEVSRVSEKAFWLVNGKLQEEAPSHGNGKQVENLMKINEEKTNNHILKVELQRAFQNPRWILIVLIGVVLFIIGKTRFPQITVTGEYAINTTNRLMLAMSYSELAFIVPLLILIPYADSLLNDIQSRAIDFLVFRSGRKDYLRSKLFAIGLSGGVCLVMVLLVMVLSSSVYGINFKSGIYATGMVNETEPFGPFSALFMTKPALYLVYLFVSAFLFGITYSLFGTAMSVIFKNKFIGFSVPLFLFQIVDFIGVSMNPQPWYLIPLRGLMPFNTARPVGNHDLLLQMVQYLIVLIPSLIMIGLVMKSYGKK